MRSVFPIVQRSLSAAGARPRYRVAVTGAAGQIGYALLFRIASGHLFGPNADVELHCVDLPFTANALQGVKMELEDCAFPLLKKIVTTSNLDEGFDKIDAAILVGAKPRGPGMERQHLLKDNGSIFKGQGETLNRVASKNVKVLVVGNPANTNCLIAASHAPNIDPRNFSAMTRLDHNRAIAQLAEKFNVESQDVKHVTIWGNHSSTQVPDYTLPLIKGKSVNDPANAEWFSKTFVPTVQQRGAAIIKARGFSSAASAASAALDHMRDWCLGSNGEWVSMAVLSGAYGTPKGLYFSYPTICKPGFKYEIVENLKMNPTITELVKLTTKELQDEKDMVSSLLGPAKLE